MSEFASKFVTIIPSFQGGGAKIQRDLDAMGDTGGRSAGKKAGSGFAASFGGSLKGFAGGLVATMGVGALVQGFSAATSAASDLNETVNKAQVIFGKNFGSIDKWASGAAQSLGLSHQAALDAAAGFGDMFSQIGFAGGEAAKMSQSVVQMSADLGSFNNLETDDVAQRISAAFRGEYDSLQALIPNINAARVEHEAMAATGKKSAAALTAQEKAAAVLAIVQKDGARAMGDFARTSDGAANKQKILAAKMEDLKAKTGNALLPIKSLAIDGLTRLVDGAAKLGPALSRVGGFFGPVVASVKGFFSSLTSGQGAGSGFTSWLTGTLLPAVMGVVGAVQGWASKALPIVQQFVTGLMSRLAPMLPTIRSIFATVGQIITTALSLVQAVIQRVTSVMTWVWQNFGSSILNVTTSTFGALLGIIQPALGIIKGVIQLVLSVIKGDWSGAWNAIKSILANAWGLIKGIVSGAMSVVRSVIALGWNVIKAATGAAWAAIKGVISGAWSVIKGLVSGAVAAIKGAISRAWESVKSTTSSAWARIKAAVSDGVGRVVSTLAGLPGRAVAAVGNLGSLLWQKGVDLIQGFINGIQHMAGAVASAVSGVLSHVPGLGRLAGGRSAAPAGGRALGPSASSRSSYRAVRGVGAQAGASVTAEALADAMRVMAVGLTVEMDGHRVGRLVSRYQDQTVGRR